MLHCRPNTARISYLLAFTARDVAVALGRSAHDPVQWRWTSRFCGSAPGSCTLDASDIEALVGAVERLLRRYRAARASGSGRGLVGNLEALFWIFYEAIERCVDVDETDCICSWRRRIDDAEQLATFLIDVVRVYWSTGAKGDWMFKDLERLACRANDVAERDGSIARRPEDDQSVEASADRLSVLLFDAANDLTCDNWGGEEWMWIVPPG